MREPIIFIVIFIVAMAFAFTGMLMMERKYHSEAIERGYAHYDAYTGKWEWNSK